jgi:hypothetical protein
MFPKAPESWSMGHLGPSYRSHLWTRSRRESNARSSDRHGLEHRPNATRPRSLGAASRRHRPVRAHPTHRADPNRGHQLAWSFPVPGRTLCRQNPALCHCRKNDGGKGVRSQNSATIFLLSADLNASPNQTLARRTFVTLGRYTLPLPYVVARKMRRPRVIIQLI